LGDNLRNQAGSLYRQGKYTEAKSKADEALKIYRQSFGPHYDHYPTALAIQGLALTRMGEHEQGEHLLREALKLRIGSLPKGHYFTALAQSSLGECLMIEKRYGEAEPLLRESYESLRESQGPANPRTLLAKERLATLYQAMNKPALAAKYSD
jgi:tetratricopeptide (TPR) repeat protein